MTMLLGTLLDLTSLDTTTADALAALSIGDLRVDSRQIREGDVFVCLGAEQYIPQVIKAGASVVLLDAQTVDKQAAEAQVIDARGFDANTDLRKSLLAVVSTTEQNGVPVLAIDKLSKHTSLLAACRYRQRLPMIGVTGTNGKSTLVSLIAQLIQKTTQRKIGTIGTLGVGLWGKGYHETGMTTPDIFTNYASAEALAEQQASAIAIEVSSHGLMQDRVEGLPIHTAIFTNLTQDHLDYHGTLEDYRDAKRRLFLLPSVKTAVINADDTNASAMIAGSDHLNVLRFGIQSSAAVQASELRALPNGMQFKLKTPWGSAFITSPLLGVFNVYNLLAAICAAAIEGIPFHDITRQIPSLEAIPGRMECLPSVEGIQTVVDFAHTPDALEQALKAIKAHTVGRIWVVFGCGGDRDKQKRALMGAVADEIADHIVITSDNPRSEDPSEIMSAIASGCKKPTQLIEDRYEAIAFAIDQAAAGDSLLIAGKGHETYQLIGDKKLPFSDVDVAKTLLQQRLESALMHHDRGVSL